jgi:subtilisin-like proprotein convertase family protein
MKTFIGPRLLRYVLLATFLVGSAAGASAQTHSIFAASIRSSTGDVAIPVPPVGTSGTTNVPLYVPLSGLVTDVKVRIRVNHSFDGDLLITLFHPNPTVGGVALVNHRGASGDDFGTGATSCAGTQTEFDDEAAGSIITASPPFAGSFSPEGGLGGVFDGQAARGVWRLELNDTVDGDSGTLYCFTLEIAVNPLGQALMDVDGDGTTQPLTDGLLELRWLFGFSGNVLVNDAVGMGCTRCTAAEIEAFLQALDD